ncbi:hypothetical protein Q5P01_021590 [Channa striata]|uniref:ALMS motif domain-containing protein n=1 Tax=Channa striata TaxID=64152 RepID=A0AA88LUJ0_CHASR|nr:hypothetical protein Q5P01_021590 [Channa striata]
MSAGSCSRGFPNPSTPGISEASSQDTAASLHRNALSWGVWWGQEKENVSLGAITPSVCSHTADTGSCSGVSNLFRTVSVPDLAGRSPTTAFSSITFGARKVRPSLSASKDPVRSSVPTRPVKTSAEVYGRRFWSSPMCARHVSNSQPDLSRQIITTETHTDFRQVRSPADGLAARDPEKREVQLVQHRPKCTEVDREQDVTSGSLRSLTSQPSYQSCIRRQVPLRSYRSVVFLDKSLSISLVDLERRGAEEEGRKQTLYTSTFSLRFGVSSCCRSSADSKSAKTDEAYRGPRAAALGRNKCNGQGSRLVHCRGLLIKQRGCKVEQIAPAHGVNNKAGDSDTQRHSATLGILSFTGPSPSNTKAGRQKGNADEAAFPTRSNFRHRQHTFNTGPVDIRTWSHQPMSDKTHEHEEPLCNTGLQKVLALDETCYYHSRVKADVLEKTPKILSLKEALEIFRPDFISRSQSRVRRLEQRAERRRAQPQSHPDRVGGLRADRGRQRTICTTPHPLSDNLFKPRERSISGREMQLRSRRIYNKLPEVTKKKEEEKKRAVSQTNRLRAEVFKKRLLDQILQR